MQVSFLDDFFDETIPANILRAAETINEFIDKFLEHPYGRNHDVAETIYQFGGDRTGFPETVRGYDVVYHFEFSEYEETLDVYFAANRDFQLEDLSTIDILDQINQIEDSWAYFTIPRDGGDGAYLPSGDLLYCLRDLASE
ncbi:MAG: hypothetical protein CMM93_03045 [Rickettsiales bacterium]|nr:hypothetical protein [Rickettsiales bacterium]